MLYALIALCGILSFMAVKSTYYPLKWAAGFSWWAFLFYWLTNPVPAIARGDPTDIAIMGILIFLGVLFLLWGMAGRKGKSTATVEERYSSAGKLVDRIVKSTEHNHSNQSSSSDRESASEYKQKVRAALSKKGTGKR